MYLIVGLGNPEEEYKDTRHNMGFDVINEISKKYKIEVTHFKFKGFYGIGTIENEKVILLKPQTYMNLSGESINELKKFYKIENKDIIFIFDDIDIEPGKIRIRKNGSAGSHNGAKSILNSLGTEDILRIRVGIGKPKEKEDLINYVINKKITKKEKEELNIGVNLATSAIYEIIINGIDSAMNKFN